MEKYTYIKELLSTAIGAEGTVLIPRKIYETLIEEVDKALIPRSEAAYYYGAAQIPGTSIDLNLQALNKMKVRLTGEGAEIVQDQTEYSGTNVKPKKYSVSVAVSRELMEDAQWNLLEDNIRIAGKRFAENENSLVIAALDGAANTVSGGAAITIANITRARQYLHDSDFKPTTFVIGYEVLNDLNNIDTFVEFQKVGNTDMLTKGFLGNIFGMNVIATSTNAGMTTTSSYIFDRDHAYIIAEKRPVSIENLNLPQFDQERAYITQRITTAALRTGAIAKITTT